MDNNESNNGATNDSQQTEASTADRRSFIRTAVKTAVAGTVGVGIVGAAGAAVAGPSTRAGAAVEVPQAVVKARVLFNNQMQISRDQIIDILGGIFNGSNCTVCGLGGIPHGPGTVTQISLETAYLAKDQPVAVLFQDDCSC